MSDEGYIAVKQSEDRNYGTVAMTEEEQSPSVAEEAPSTQQVRINVLELAYLIHRTDLLRPHLYSTEGGWSTMTLLLTPTYNTTGILLSHDPPSRHCYRHGAGGELSDDGLTERFYTPYISFDTFLHRPPSRRSPGRRSWKHGRELQRRQLWSIRPSKARSRSISPTLLSSLRTGCKSETKFLLFLATFHI